MNEKQIKDLIQSYLKVTARMNEAVNLPLHFGTEEKLYPSEIHTVDLVGDHPSNNLTELADIAGVTKGAVSKMIKRLEAKGYLLKFQQPDNKKDTYLKLTKKGELVYQFHKEHHQKIDSLLASHITTFSDEELNGVSKLVTVISDLLDQLPNQ